jgi:hypothetical protein
MNRHAAKAQHVGKPRLFYQNLPGSASRHMIPAAYPVTSCNVAYRFILDVYISLVFNESIIRGERL